MMVEEYTVFDWLKIVFFWVSPALFIIGVTLLILSLESYKKLEGALNKNIGGIKKVVVPKLEANIYTLHDWLLNRKTIIGMLCIVCSLGFFMLLKG